MESTIGWIVMVIIVQGVGAVINYKKKQKQKRKLSGTAQTAKMAQPTQKSDPVGLIFNKLELMHTNSKQPTAKKPEAAKPSERMIYQERDRMDLDAVKSYGSEDEATLKKNPISQPKTVHPYEEEWVTSSHKEEELEVAPSMASPVLEAQVKGHSHFLNELPKRPSLQQGILWQEILSPPVSMRIESQ